MRRFILSLILAALCVVTAVADVIVEDAPDMRRMRAEFLTAERALKQGALARYRKLADGLRDYPLYPYLRYEYLRGRLHQLPAARIVEFADTYANVPPARRLHTTWLEMLARRGRWETLLRHIPEQQADTELECHRRWALYRTKRREAAFDGLEHLWLVGHSQPRACDRIFRAWYRSDKFRPALAWQRFGLAMNEKKLRLARYLVRFMDDDHRRRAQLWLRVHRTPEKIISSGQWPVDEETARAILLYGIKRMVWQDTRRAIEVWDGTLTARHAFSRRETGEVERTIGMALAVRGEPEALSWLAVVEDKASDLALREWRVRAALMQGNWYAALAWISQIDGHARSSPRWRYWKARALEALDQPREAEELYLDLAMSRGYYGFLAADRLDLPYALNHSPIADDLVGAVDVRAYPGLLRARELFLLDRTVEARREWYYATRDMADWQLAAAAKLAQGWGWHDRAIMTVARTGHRDDLELRFPLVHQAQIVAEAKAHNVDPALAYGIIRQESAFTADARSHAGAMGLMQLLPTTARRLARHMNIHLPNRMALLDLTTNLQLGMAHLRRMLDRYNNQVVAAAAYNAGEHRVDQWLPQDGMITADLWAETVPYKETRHYIQNVLYFATIYGQRMGTDMTSLTRRMRPVTPEGGTTQSASRAPADRDRPGAG